MCTNIAEPHHVYATPASYPGKNFDTVKIPSGHSPMAPNPVAPAPTLLQSKPTFTKRI
jgi:hypothetical protein